MEKPNSKMLAKLQAGGLIVSVKLNITHHAPAAMAAMCGFDAVWVDMEHVPSDYAEINQTVLAAMAYGAETIVRVPRGCYSNLIRPLEMDAAAIMVPHVMSEQDAREVARMTKFHPTGRRPIDGGNADGLYCMMDSKDYIHFSNSQRLTIIQIEDFEALEQVDDIARVEGIDMLFFGPADFAHSLGSPTQTGSPQVSKAREKVALAAQRHGKFAGTVGHPGNVKELYDMGYRYVNLGADVAILKNGFHTILNNYRAAMEGQNETT